MHALCIRRDGIDEICQMITSYFLLFQTKGISFSSDGKFMALAERRNCKDYISVFACDNWQMLKVNLNVMFMNINNRKIYFGPFC